MQRVNWVDFVAAVPLVLHSPFLSFLLIFSTYFYLSCFISVVRCVLCIRLLSWHAQILLPNFITQMIDDGQLSINYLSTLYILSKLIDLISSFSVALWQMLELNSLCLLWRMLGFPYFRKILPLRIVKLVDLISLCSLQVPQTRNCTSWRDSKSSESSLVKHNG